MDIPKLINKAVKKPPPSELLKYCEPYYSPYYYLMFLLAEEIGKGLLVELGVHKGRGIFALASASLANTVIGIDTKNEIGDLESKFSNFIFLNQPSLPPSEQITRKIDLLHIDTEHTHSMVKAEFISYKPFLKKGAYVLFDDLHAANDDVLHFFESLPYPKWTDDRLHPECGYGLLIYQEDK